MPWKIILLIGSALAFGLNACKVPAAVNWDALGKALFVASFLAVH